MENKTISQEDYEKAIDTINRFRIENVGFYAKLNVDREDCSYFDDLQDLMRAIYLCGAEGKQIKDCIQIDEKTFNENYLPY